MNHSPDNSPPRSDIWSEWLLGKRHGGDPHHAKTVQGGIERIRDRVLDGAQLSAGMTLVDVGSGDGLVAFGALARAGPSLRVILTDLSAPLLAHAERCAVERGLRDRCTFLQGSAERLDGVADASVDVVTTRAVLAYVGDQSAALGEFHRVLKPGGRLSIAEPILRDTALEVAALGRVLGARTAGARQLALLWRWKAAQFPATEAAIQASPVTNFSERDLVARCQQAGFGEIHLELHIDVRKKAPVPWETFLELSPYPSAPSLREILGSGFNEEERREFVACVRPAVESDEGYERETIAYLTAVKPLRPAPVPPAERSRGTFV